MPMDQVELSSSQEDYLEAIYFLSRQGEGARSKDIAARLQVRPASVTGALKALAEKGVINYAPYGEVSLTDRGYQIATLVAGKHEALLHFFTQVLGLSREEAEEFACTMEHSIPDQILERLVCFAEYTERCPGFTAAWQENAEGYFCRATGHPSPHCGDCNLLCDDASPRK